MSVKLKIAKPDGIYLPFAGLRGNAEQARCLLFAVPREKLKSPLFGVPAKKAGQVSEGESAVASPTTSIERNPTFELELSKH